MENILEQGKENLNGIKDQINATEKRIDKQKTQLTDIKCLQERKTLLKMESISDEQKRKTLLKN